MRPRPAGSEGARPWRTARTVERTAASAPTNRTSGPPAMTPIALSPSTTFRGALTQWTSCRLPPRALAGSHGPLRPLLDPAQHLALHHQRARLHHKHRQALAGRRPLHRDPVAAD